MRCVLVVWGEDGADLCVVSVGDEDKGHEEEPEVYLLRDGDGAGQAVGHELVSGH